MLAYTLGPWHLENKGMIFKARLVCTAWYKHGRDHYFMPSSFHAKIMVMPVFYQAVQNRRALTTIPLFSFLITFKNKCKLWPQIFYNNEAVPFNMKIKPCVLMDQCGARYMRMKHSKSAARRVSIVWHKHRQEPIRLQKLSQSNILY